MVTNSYFADVAVLLGNGDGSFRQSLLFGTGNTPYRVIVADMNGDGKPDLITANWGSNNISLLINTTSQQEAGDRANVSDIVRTIQQRFGVLAKP